MLSAEHGGETNDDLLELLLPDAIDEGVGVGEPNARAAALRDGEAPAVKAGDEPDLRNRVEFEDGEDEAVDLPERLRPEPLDIVAHDAEVSEVRLACRAEGELDQEEEEGKGSACTGGMPTSGARRKWEEEGKGYRRGRRVNSGSNLI
jgi:hypothetical protein